MGLWEGVKADKILWVVFIEFFLFQSSLLLMSCR